MSLDKESLGTNVNTPIFQAATREFGHGAGAQVQGLELSGTQSVNTTPFCSGIQAPSADGPYSLWNTKTLKQKVRKFAAFLTGVEGLFVLSYVKCFVWAYICGVVFVHNNLDFDTFIARTDIFFHSGFNASLFEWLGRCHMGVEFVLAVS